LARSRVDAADIPDKYFRLELMPAADQYRPAQRTPPPRILGPQTAVVLGSHDGIYSDEYGRIKVQFHWDRTKKTHTERGCFTVLTGVLPQARVGDMCVCVGPPDTIAKAQRR
jgi:hypothetical protein